MKNIKLKFAAALVILAGIGSLVFYSTNQNNTTEQAPIAQESTSVAKLSVSEDGQSVSYEGIEGKTALEILKSLTTVSTKQTDFGEFVTGIHGVEADGAKQFWAFYVDGMMASEGAGTYKTKNGEKIEWRLEDIQP